MFAVVSSAFGAHLSMSVIIIIGLASIFADALSMYDFLSIHSLHKHFDTF